MFSRKTAVPTVLVYLVALVVLGLVAFLVALVTDRNPLPFPDRDYHVFSASSPEALVALEQLMQIQGHRPRFRIDSPGSTVPSSATARFTGTKMASSTRRRPLRADCPPCHCPATPSS